MLYAILLLVLAWVTPYQTDAPTPVYLTADGMLYTIDAAGVMPAGDCRDADAAYHADAAISADGGWLVYRSLWRADAEESAIIVCDRATGTAAAITASPSSRMRRGSRRRRGAGRSTTGRGVRCASRSGG